MSESAIQQERLQAFLEEMWSDNTEEEAELLWKRRVLRTPQYAADALVALNATIAQPPANLREILEEHGQINLMRRPDHDTVTPYTFEETVAWLKAMTARFRTLYDEGQAAK